MSDPRRCPVCGEPVDEGAHFCINCGTRLDDSGDASPETTAAHPPVSPTANVAQPPYATPATPMPSPAPAPSPEPPRNRSREITIALASVAAALAVVAVVLAVVNFIPRQTQDSGNAAQQAQTQTSNGSTDSSQQSDSGQGGQPSTNVTYYIGEGGTSSSTGTGSSSSPAPSSTSSDDASIRSTLQAQKGTLNSLDTQIRNVASDFNRYSKNGSWDQQEAAASTASSVQGSVSSASSSFDGIYVPTSSAYYGTYQSMQTCYDDLQNRIDCMVSSWSLRLSGSSDYLSPIRAQNDSKGVNVYKTDFENRMASLGI